MKTEIQDWMKPVIPYLNKKGYTEKEEIYNACSNALAYRIVEEIGKITSDASKSKNFSLEDKLEFGKYDIALNLDRVVSKGDPLTTNNIGGQIKINYKDKSDKSYHPLLVYDIIHAAGVIFKAQEIEEYNKELRKKFIKNLIEDIRKNDFLKNPEEAKETLDLALKEDILKLGNSSKIVNLICDNLEYSSPKEARYVKRKINEFPKLQKKVVGSINNFVEKLDERKARGRNRIKEANFMLNFVDYLENRGLDPAEEIQNTLDKLFSENKLKKK